MLYKIKLNGANAEKVAELMGGVLIMETSDGIATISGGDTSKLILSEVIS